MSIPKTFIALFFLFGSTNIHSQNFFKRFQTYMKAHLPEGWSMRQCRDSLFVFNKLVHWQEALDPPMDSNGYDDTMSMYVCFYPVQTDSEKTVQRSMLDRTNIQIEELQNHRMDSVYRGKRGFYDWWGKLVHLQIKKLLFEFTYFKKCSITYYYWQLFDKLKSYDDKVDDEAEQIKKILVKYLDDPKHVE